MPVKLNLTTNLYLMLKQFIQKQKYSCTNYLLIKIIYKKWFGVKQLILVYMSLTNNQSKPICMSCPVCQDMLLALNCYFSMQSLSMMHVVH